MGRLLAIFYVVIGYAATMFIYSHLLYGIFYFLPKSIYFVSKGELKPVAILRVLVLPIIILVGGIIVGYLFANNETFIELATSMQVAIGSWIALAVLIIQGFISKKGRNKLDERFWKMNEKKAHQPNLPTDLQKQLLAVSIYNNGYTKFTQGNFKGAMSDYSKAIQINPIYVDAYCSRSFLNSFFGKYDEAIQDADKAINIKPDHADSYYMRGQVKGKLKDYFGAIEDYTKSLEINPIDSGTYFMRANAKDEIQDYKGSIQDYNKAIENNSAYSEAYCLRGFAKKNLSDESGACLDWHKAVELGNEEASELIKKFCK